jgi:hypothetical protein
MTTKLLKIAIFAASVALSANAFAADTPTALSGTTVISNVDDCTALSNDVTIQLSNGVFASYDCNPAPSAIVAGACHGSGTNKSQDFECTYTASLQEDGSTIYLTETGCTTWDGTGTEPVATYTNSGVVGYRGSSAGGSVGVTGMGVLTCDATTVLGLVQ